MYTPINEHKLSRENKEILKKFKNMSPYSVKVIYAKKKFYDELTASITPSERNNYRDEIPFMGKLIKPVIR